MKKLISILFLLITLAGYSQHHMMHTLAGQSGGGTIPEYIDKGTTGTATSITSDVRITPTYPTTINSGDFLLLVVSVSRDKYVTSLDYSGTWNLLFSEVSQINHQTTAWWKIADGTEDGLNQTINYSGVLSAGIAIIYRFTGVNGTTPFGNFQLMSDWGLSMTLSGAVTTAYGSLGIAVFAQEDDIPVTTTLNGWVEEYSEVRQEGTDNTQILNSYESDYPQTLPNITWSQSTDEYMSVFYIELFGN